MPHASQAAQANLRLNRPKLEERVKRVCHLTDRQVQRLPTLQLLELLKRSQNKRSGPEERSGWRPSTRTFQEPPLFEARPKGALEVDLGAGATENYAAVTQSGTSQDDETETVFEVQHLKPTQESERLYEECKAALECHLQIFRMHQENLKLLATVQSDMQDNKCALEDDTLLVLQKSVDKSEALLKMTERQVRQLKDKFFAIADAQEADLRQMHERWHHVDDKFDLHCRRKLDMLTRRKRKMDKLSLTRVPES